MAELTRKTLAWGVKSLLFLSAYSPLGIILAVLIWPESRCYSIALGIVVLASLGFLWLLFHELKDSEPTEVDAEQIQRRDADIVSYVVTYAIPFLAVPFESAEISLGLGIFFVIVWLLQVKLNLLYINPILAVFNYHLYEVTMAGTVQILVSRKRVRPAGTIYVVKAGDNFLLEDES